MKAIDVMFVGAVVFLVAGAVLGNQWLFGIGCLLGFCLLLVMFVVLVWAEIQLIRALFMISRSSRG